MLKTKSLILFLTFILLVSLVSATIDIKIIQYDPPSQAARIQISNIGETDYTDVLMKIDDNNEEKVVGLLRPKTAIIKSRIVSQGTHKITVTTKEGKVFTEELYFTKSAEIVEEEIKNETEERLKREEEQIKQAEEIEKQKEEQLIVEEFKKEEKSNTGLIITAIFLLLVLIGLLYISKKTRRKKRKIPILKKIGHIQKPISRRVRYIPKHIKKIIIPEIKPKIIPPEIKPETPLQKLDKIRLEKKDAFEKLNDIGKKQTKLEKDIFEKLSEIKKEEKDIFNYIQSLKKPIVKPEAKTSSLDRLKRLRKVQKKAYNNLMTLEKKQKLLITKLKDIGKSQDIFTKLSKIK